MTLQSIAGSDYFGPVHWSISTDNAKTWSRRHRSLAWANAIQGQHRAGRRCRARVSREDEHGTRHGAHAHYKDGRFFTPQPPRWPVTSSAMRRANGRNARSLNGTIMRRRHLHGRLRSTRHFAQRDVLVPISLALTPISLGSVATLLVQFRRPIVDGQGNWQSNSGKVARSTGTVAGIP